MLDRLPVCDVRVGGLLTRDDRLELIRSPLLRRLAGWIARKSGNRRGWFLTVLGPGSDAAHSDHMHLDIQQHGSSDRYRICQ